MEKGSLIIDIRYSSGFFSNFLIWVDNLKYCEISNLKPIMRLGSPYQVKDWYYSDGRSNLWEYYFENINDGIPIGNLEYSNFFKFWDNDAFTCYVGKVPVWDNIGDEEKCLDNRFKVNKIIKKIKPTKIIQTKVDEFIQNNLEGKKILGVHVRGTDYGFENINEYVNQIEKCYNDFDAVFVASDNMEAIELIKNSFKNVYFYNTNIRMPKYNDGVLCNNLNVIVGGNKLKHGEDVLIECILLSKCNHLICINSNVAATALYMNPEMTYNMIYRSPHGG